MARKKASANRPDMAFAFRDGMGTYNVSYHPAGKIDRAVGLGYLEGLVQQGVQVVRDEMTAPKTVSVGAVVGSKVVWVRRPTGPLNPPVLPHPVVSA